MVPEIDEQVHAYERSNRVYNYSLDPCGPVHIAVGDGGNREKMAIEFADEPGKCPEPSSTPDPYMGGFCAANFTFGPAEGKFCWEWQPEFSAFRESSFGHGILEVPLSSYPTSLPFPIPHMCKYSISLTVQVLYAIS